MAKIQFDPELMRNIKIIYGDADLDERTLRQLYQTWATNPDIIRRTAQQKMPKLQEAYFDAPEISTQSERLQSPIPVEIADDDLRGIKDFNTAFGEARKRGLKQFMWGKGRYGTELAKQTPSQNVNLRPLPTPQSSSDGLRNMQEDLKQKNDYIKYRRYHTKYPFAHKSLSWSPDVLSSKEALEIWRERGVSSPMGEESNDFNGNRGFTPLEIINSRMKYQQGGTMNDQQELQKAFVAYLVQDAQSQGVQIQSEQDLQAYAEQLGEDGIKAKYQEFMQKMQGGVMARLGAKLEYYKKLKGVCPEGEELVYFKQGGRICKACQKAQKGTKVTKKANEVDKFKAGRAQYKKDMKSAKDEAARDSVAINKWGDQEVAADKGHKGTYKNGVWTPNRKQYTKKNACGSKMKKK